MSLICREMYLMLQREGTSLSGSTEDALRTLLTYLSNPSKTELSNASGADVSTATAGPNVSPRMSLQVRLPVVLFHC